MRARLTMAGLHFEARWSSSGLQALRLLPKNAPRLRAVTKFSMRERRFLRTLRHALRQFETSEKPWSPLAPPAAGKLAVSGDTAYNRPNFAKKFFVGRSERAAPRDGAIRLSQKPQFLQKRSTSPAILMDWSGASDFQKAVWQELQKIPWGETRSYLEIARRIGRPRAARAVGAACAANPILLLVPCHRVIGSDGSLGGFSSGIGLKKSLLARERVNETSARIRCSGGLRPSPPDGKLWNRRSYLSAVAESAATITFEEVS